MKNQLTPPTDYVFQNPFSEEVSSKLEMERHEFECKKAKLLRDISSLQEENYQLKIDVQIEKSKTEKWTRQIIGRMEGRNKQHQRWDGVLKRESERGGKSYTCYDRLKEEEC
ncbi:hypothetical protein Gotri_025547 [Gossypium trilobum]|uniref:Uncharacterized protein n=1 Tax=Gossypium trilobum TaxID=34281 RepID=A0A7J9FQQ1_9ROSI|nr:hypothetical protein [Gossypium trilobum]